MKVSILQQFSSNHSGSFAVVGRFATEEAAKSAAEKLAEVIRRVEDWHANSENEAAYQHSPDSITPVEKAIFDEYALEDWDYQAIDWYGSVHAQLDWTRRLFLDR